VNEPLTTPADTAPPAAAAPVAAAPAEAPQAPRLQPLWVAFAILAALCAGGLVLAWQGQQRVQMLEQELVRRQQDVQTQTAEALLLARQAQDGAREAAARSALLDARITEVAVQRGQIEELIQSLSRSRDENVVVDIDAALRVATQQAALTGSAEPLVAALKQADERLARYSQPRLEGVRRAIARDLDRVKAMGVADVAALTIKLDEVIRMVDDLPLLSQAEPRKDAPRPAASASAPTSAAPKAARGPTAAASAASPDRSPWSDWLQPWIVRWDGFAGRVWSETQQLLRVTRIDHPEAMLLAPDQAYFLRENLKLRLLNARLALLSRQFDIAQSDLQNVLGALDRHFDRSSRRTQLAADLIRQVAGQARQVGVPRPDATLAALSTAAAGR